MRLSLPHATSTGRDGECSAHLLTGLGFDVIVLTCTNGIVQLILTSPEAMVVTSAPQLANGQNANRNKQTHRFC